MKVSLKIPFLPYGAIVPDPVLYEVPNQKPYMVHLDLEVIRKLFPDPEIASLIYWSPEEIILPPIPIDLILSWMSAEKLEPYPGQMYQLHLIKNSSLQGTTILHRPAYPGQFGPGWFQALDWDGVIEQEDPAEESNVA